MVLAAPIQGSFPVIIYRALTNLYYLLVPINNVMYTHFSLPSGDRCTTSVILTGPLPLNNILLFLLSKSYFFRLFHKTFLCFFFRFFAFVFCCILFAD
jgi:hypothetical protein